ncbi:glycoside hydrolase family 88 protein [Paenibacillus sp. J31TS4]|uniref:glycoside hydrolase family 88 protein n=1 Tax=Paenibacillus sp. J31TS4 TaxID=2807195 RepID=UPI0020BF0E84|nr:glycoside hydrolase family 88 protein [Paenibacillus sp. J31TS4]
MLQQIGSRSPHRTENGLYDDCRHDWWTSGFWPGMLWLMYGLTGKESYREAAAPWDGRLEQCFVQPSNLHHDVGFQFLPTAVLHYKLLGDSEGRRRGLAAANFLAGRFNLAGRFLRAWNQEKAGWAIIDSCMNLSLLYWASAELADPRFAQIATAHAETVLQHFVRPDGSVCHIVRFDPASGECLEEIGGQGFGPGSAWSRGQAWALYGFANTYRYTGDERFLAASQRIAHHFLACLPDDSVPLWDFRLPEPAGEPKDTSAAACAASGLLELAKLVPYPQNRLYREAASRILLSLTDGFANLASGREDEQGILREGTGHCPEGVNVNVSLIYGDYFYVEALAKAKGWYPDVF